jgi:hypothetical protein
MNPTLNELIKKYIDFGSEEYVKDVVTKANPGRQLVIVNPYIGIINYPSDQFLNSQKNYNKTVQFQNSHYVGCMEFLLPELVAPVDTGLSYTLLKFNLDGIVRSFLQISSGSSVSQTIRFDNFIKSLFPNAGDLFPFNRAAWHILTDIEISGGTYSANANGSPFSLITSGVGAFTPAIQFEFAVSGYRCIMQ